MMVWNDYYRKRGLWLVDPELAKRSLLCKWIIHDMKPDKSNLQMMLKYRLARWNLYRVETRG